jgi:hypothetical protein
VALTPGRPGARPGRWAARAILVLGAVFLVFGLSLLILFGFSGPGLPALVWGLLLIVVYGFFEPETMRAFLGQGQLQSGARALVMVILVIAAAVILNVLARDRLGDKQWDLTKNRVNSFAPQTETIVKSIDKPVTVTLWAQNSPSENQAAFELLQRYRALNGRITIRSYSVVERPTLAQEQKIQQAGSAVVEIAGRPSEITTDLTEAGFDTVFLRLSTGKSPKAYFLTGHGEPDTQNPSRTGNSVTLLRQALVKQGFTVAVLNLTAGGGAAPGGPSLGAPQASPSPGGVAPSPSPVPSAAPSPPGASPSPGVTASDRVPADADELVILDPRVNLGAGEISAINAFLDQGGHVLISQPPGVTTNVNELLKRFGLSFGTGVVVDPQLQARGYQPGVLAIQSYGQSVVSRGLESLPSLLLDTAVQGQAAKGYSLTPVVTTTGDACLKPDIQSAASGCGSGDKKGNLNLIVTVEQTGLKAGAKPARVLVMGGASFASDVFALSQQQSPPGNQPLMINAMNWLAGQDKVINVPPRPNRPQAIFLTDGQRQLVLLGYPVLLPLLLLGLGVNAYLRRR